MIETRMGRKELIVRRWFAANHESRVPTDKSVQDLFQEFKQAEADAGVSYGLFNGVVKKIRLELPGQIEVNIETGPVEAEIVSIGELQFPDIRAWKTDSLLDNLFSDHDDLIGALSGTANIVVGEPGVGKSTVMLDILAKIKAAQPHARLLYLSSEMTRNDLYFYWRKTPAIAEIPTLLLTDYIGARFDQILHTTLQGDWDIILIDSYEDILIKMTDVLGWSSKRAAAWLTQLIIQAADVHGKTIFAIQHMTKSGTYKGGTYLKHATTSMLEIRKDHKGRRYATFSKNRRSGSNVDRRLYYKLEAGTLIWSDQILTEEEVALQDAAAEALASQE